MLQQGASFSMAQEEETTNIFMFNILSDGRSAFRLQSGQFFLIGSRQT